MATVQTTGLRKRQQISQANRMMFLWIAGVSVIIGFSLVGSIFLVQKLAFNEKVLSEKAKTVNTLKKDNAAVASLKDNIRKLNSDSNLNALKTGSENDALQVVLDALPSDANSSALGASIQQKLVAGIDGLSLDSLTVTPVAGVEQSADTSSDPSTGSGNQIAFSLKATGDVNALHQLLTNLERSIRSIDVTTLGVESQNGALQLSIEGNAFYQPQRSIALTDKVVKQ